MTDMTNALDRYNVNKAPCDKLYGDFFLMKFKELEKELEKRGIAFRYLDYMGQWFNGTYFTSYSWDEISEQLQYESNKNMPFIFTDDIELCLALRYQQCLFFSHMLNNDDDLERAAQAFQIVFDIDIRATNSDQKINVPIKQYDYERIKRERENLNHMIIAALHHPNRIAKWLNAGNDIEEYLP